MGKGFAFVERQQRIRFDDEDFYIDLVFYNYKLKCFVLIDLKLGKLKHQDVGQMDTYVRLYNEKYKAADDNPTVGLVLCSEKSEAVARYSVLADQKQFFAVKYFTLFAKRRRVAGSFGCAARSSDKAFGKSRKLKASFKSIQTTMNAKNNALTA